MTENIPSPDELRALADELEDDQQDDGEDDRINDLIEILSPYEDCTVKNTPVSGKYIFGIESVEFLRDSKELTTVRESDEFEVGGVQWGNELEYITDGVELRIYDTEVYDD
jgi:hypothetical protein